MCRVCFTRRSTLVALASGFAAISAAHAQQGPHRSATPAGPVVIQNVNVFDGTGSQLRPGSVMVADRKIKQVSAGSIAPPLGSTVLDGQGRVLMPGLTDAHWHMTMAPNTLANLEESDTGLMYANTVAEAQRTLMRGFTTIRDTAGPTFGIKAAIDAGVIAGPRVYPSGALISQTSGHGDFSPAYARPHTTGGHASHFEEIGEFAVANGVPEVLASVRDQLRKGASQIKLAVGGGVISASDPVENAPVHAR